MLGGFLKKGEPIELFDRFKELKSELPEEIQSLIPNAVCFGLRELQDYLSIVQEALENRQIPEDERGIALMFGKYGDEVEKKHLANKVTVMLIPSRAAADEDGKVTKIENAVIYEGEFELRGPVPDIGYNVGSLQP